jgi:methylamine dehydrogenase heavy chain
VTQQEKPLLIASRSDGVLDVYDAATGAFVRSIGGTASDPLVMTAVR